MTAGANRDQKTEPHFGTRTRVALPERALDRFWTTVERLMVELRNYDKVN